MNEEQYDMTSVLLSDGELTMSVTRNGHRILAYKTGKITYRGAATVANHVKKDDLSIALSFVKANKGKISAFYPKIGEIVGECYRDNGDTEWFENTRNRETVRKFPQLFKAAAIDNKMAGHIFSGDDITRIEYIKDILDP